MPLRRLAIRALAGLLALPAAYLLAALLAGLLPVNKGWQAPADGIAVYLQDSNGVHTSLALPVQTPQQHWNALFSPRQTQRPELSAAQPYLAIGWGSRTFFLRTRSWADLTAGNAIAALASDASVLHVEYLPKPAEDADTRKILLTPGQYAKLAAFIRQSAAAGADSKPLWLANERYDGNDAFYQAHGRYTPFVTCNQWTRNALAAAGVRTALWSPFTRPLFWRLHG
ncbi:TIGR02117 family protein [Chromobacterium subtsugae]|uniref:TIGR02117 family protein n=1 Tax=Chromobacterium subtsugae TaxID=251747 RepID=UPI000640E69C|nr:TIGR02117 family protein [Chromobacterium subtsugae]